VVILELVPDLTVSPSAMLHPGAGIRGVERCEVGEFQVNPVGVAKPARIGLQRMQRQTIEQLAQLDDLRFAIVDQAFAHVQVQGQDQLVSLPWWVPYPLAWRCVEGHDLEPERLQLAVDSRLATTEVGCGKRSLSREFVPVGNSHDRFGVVQLPTPHEEVAACLAEPVLGEKRRTAHAVRLLDRLKDRRSAGNVRKAHVSSSPSAVA
jgi:hypothetical protein